MTRINLQRTAEEMWEIYGRGAHRIAAESADAFLQSGDIRAAKEQRRIAQAVRFYIGPTPHSKRPYGNRRPVKGVPMHAMAKLRAELKALLDHVQ